MLNQSMTRKHSCKKVTETANTVDIYIDEDPDDLV